MANEQEPKQELDEGPIGMPASSWHAREASAFDDAARAADERGGVEESEKLRIEGMVARGKVTESLLDEIIRKKKEE
jgi:hypothetical protein